MDARKVTKTRRSSLPNSLMMAGVNSSSISTLNGLIYREELYRRRSRDRSSISGIIDIGGLSERRESNESRTSKQLRRRKTSFDILLESQRRNNPDPRPTNIERKGSLAKLPMAFQKSLSGLLAAFRGSTEGNESEDSLENLDLLVCQYNRTSVDSGYRENSISSQTACMPLLGFKTDIAAITTTYCHVKNVLYLNLTCVNLESWDVDERKKICGKISFMPNKSQPQKIKPMNFRKDLTWNKEFQFSGLTMKQLETGVIRIKFYVYSRFMVAKRSIAETCIELKRHDYRKSNKIYAIFEKSSQRKGTKS